MKPGRRCCPCRFFQGTNGPHYLNQPGSLLMAPTEPAIGAVRSRFVCNSLPTNRGLDLAIRARRTLIREEHCVLAMPNLISAPRPHCRTSSRCRRWRLRSAPNTCLPRFIYPRSLVYGTRKFCVLTASRAKESNPQVFWFDSTARLALAEFVNSRGWSRSTPFWRARMREQAVAGN